MRNVLKSKYSIGFFSILGIVIVFYVNSKVNYFTFESVKSNTNSDTIHLPQGISKLIQAYPQIIGAKQNSIIWKDGSEMVFDDGLLNKNFDSLLNNADLEDQVNHFKYSRGKPNGVPDVNFDPGRVRFEPFFLKMYGQTREEVEHNLVEIVWLPKTVNQKIRVTKINNIDVLISKISEELDNRPELRKYLEDVGGTFNWRIIMGTNRLSTHSFGCSMDINTNYSDYWQWISKNDKVQSNQSNILYKNKIPYEIVQVFEKYGFIWGGKWYHYDTMHFEYRPEMFL